MNCEGYPATSAGTAGCGMGKRDTYLAPIVLMVCKVLGSRDYHGEKSSAGEVIRHVKPRDDLRVNSSLPPTCA